MQHISAPFSDSSSSRWRWALLLSLLLGGTVPALAQSPSVGIGTTAPNAKAALEIAATDKGLLIPRLTTAQRTAISTPPAGLLVYQTDGAQPGFWYYQATAGWTFLNPTNDNLGNHTATTNVGLNGNWLSNAPGNANGIRVNNAGNVGIGTASPGAGLHVSVVEKPSISTAGGVYLSGGASGNPNIELRGTNGAAYLDFVNDLTTDYAARILSTGSGLGLHTGGDATPRLLISPTGAVTLSSLAGGGNQMLTTDNSGNLTARAYPQLALSGQTLSLSTGGSVTLPADAQQLTKSGSTISLTNGGSITDADNQALTISGLTLSLTNGGSVTLPAGADNLGNHTATQNLNLGTSQLTGNGGSAGLTVGNTGNVGIGTSSPSQKLEVAGQIYSSTGGIRFPDNSVQTTAGVASGSVVLNQTTLQSGASFNISGNGYVGGNVGIGTTAPAATAQLEVASTTKGFLPPRMTQAQRDLIASPATGLVIYNATTNKLNLWNGTSWTETLTTTEQPYQGPAVTFAYTGSPQTYTVPPGVTSLTVVARGAQGGIGTNGPNLTAPGGLGGQATATLAVTPGEVLSVRVGGAGATAVGNQRGAGYNGGGGGFEFGGGGGGASDVRRGGATLADRLLVAAGGGGGAGVPAPNSGGGGGYPTGADGDDSQYGSLAGGGGATQTAGGAGGAGAPQFAGTLGQGGATGTLLSGGGGGGLYGGGGGSNGGGGGGSSGVTPTGSSAVAYVGAIHTGNGSVTITPGPAVAAPVLNGTNIFNVPGTWDVNGTSLYHNTGNVGIGTSSPGQKLEVNGSVYANGEGSGFLVDNGASARVGLLKYGGREGGIWRTNSQDFEIGRVDAGVTALPGSPATWTTDLYVGSTGNVGIGTTAPAYPLDVQSTVSNTFTGYGYLNAAGNTGYASGTSSFAISIRASGRILASEFNAFSDARLKHIVGHSSPAADLALLNRLRITDYSMRDRVQFGDRAYKKVIAQEVEAVFPQAVTKQTGFLPDVYATATAVRAEGDSLLTFILPAGLPEGGVTAGQRLKLIGANSQVLAVVARPAAAGARTLTVRGAQQLAREPVFVYGLEHADVRAVDYEALSMLNVSATQELTRQVEWLKQQKAATQTELRAVKASFEATTAGFEARLRALEAGQGQARK